MGICRRSAATRRNRRRLGFTLIEVIAAVGVVAIFTTLIAGAAIRGLGYEGEAERRMRASLLADRVLAGIESEIRQGAVPPEGTREEEQDEFRITVDVTPFDAEALGLAPLFSAEREPGRPDRETPAVLFQPSHGAPSPLMNLAIRVQWFEAGVERDVTRSSFAFDPAAAAPFLEEVASVDEADEENPPPDEEPGTDDAERQ